jgi:mono/diheme cytochrome c family protein
MKRFIQQTMVSAVFVLSAAASVWAQGDAKDLYSSKCAACHGPDGAGKTAKGKKLKVQDVHATAAKMSADDMTKIVTDGKGQDMDGFGKQFNKDQIKGLVDYYRGLAK